ncbi:MAG TPA: hypothetical protein VLI54_06660 [Bacillota bacterium]|nr:hypothetical protein [Bacillota bacterium]
MPPQPAPAPAPDAPQPATPTAPAPTPAAPAPEKSAPALSVPEKPALPEDKPLGDIPKPSLTPPAPPKPPGPSRHLLPLFLIVGGAMLLLALFVMGAYQLGKKANTTSMQTTTTQQTVTQTLTVPKDATITAECAVARGKQYIIPKDIPTGPIYDVYQGKVVAIEYLVGETDLNKHTDMFDSLPLPKASYDHMMIMPMEAHAGENEAHFHVVAYLITKTEAAKITCAGQSMQMTGTM